MRIAMVGHKYVPSREGGVEIVVEELSKRLASQGHEVTIYNRKRKQYSPIKSYEGCKVETVFTVDKKSLDAIVYAFFATLNVRRLIKKRKLDVAHFHCEGPCFFLNLLPKNKKKYPTKVVVTIHGLDWQRGKWGGLASKIIKRGEKNAVKYADEIIVLSKNNQKYFKDTYQRETTFIPNGIEIPVMRKPEIIKDKYGLVENSYVLFLARIVPEKGLHYLLDAWKMIPPEIKRDIKLVVAGGSSHTDDYYESIVKVMSEDQTVIPTGFVQGQELEEIFSNCLIYVLPSDIEGMPMSLLEAMSYNKVCLVSNIPENVEAVDDSCFVFNKGDVYDLRSKIIDILSNKKFSLSNERQLIDWNEVVSRTIQIYS